MTQTELADAVGKSQRTISRWEQNGVPEEHVESVAEALGVEPQALREHRQTKRPKYVRSDEDASAWRDAVVDQVDDFELRALLMSMTSQKAELLDRRFWVVAASLEEVADAVNSDVEKVEELWTDIVDSKFVERLSNAKWCLALKFPEDGGE